MKAEDSDEPAHEVHPCSRCEAAERAQQGRPQSELNLHGSELVGDRDLANVTACPPVARDKQSEHHRGKGVEGLHRTRARRTARVGVKVFVHGVPPAAATCDGSARNSQRPTGILSERAGARQARHRWSIGDSFERASCPLNRVQTDLQTRRLETRRTAGDSVKRTSRCRKAIRGVMRLQPTPETLAVIFGTKRSWDRIPPPDHCHPDQRHPTSYRSPLPGISTPERPSL